MKQSTGTRLLAIAIDAAEPKLVRRLIDEGEMPALGSLLRDGTWLRVKSPAYVGSGSVWPTFMSAQGPQAHGVYGEWLWDADNMGLSRYHGNDLVPFWKSFVDSEVSVGLLDVPFMPMVGVTKGFEISEWGPHDLLEGRMQVAPESMVPTVAKYSPHPLETRVQVTGPDNYENLQKLGAVCLEGIQKRGALARTLLTETQPQIAIITFTEIHRSAHYLWHKVEPDHPVYLRSGIAKRETTHPSLIEIFRELDRQIGKLIAATNSDTNVVVFSLHGMQPAAGTPAFLAAWLCEKGFASMPGWRHQTWPERATATFGAIKRRMPSPLRTLYYKIMPPVVTHQLARPTMLPFYDWPRTRAFSLPTDQHGWIRINLAGREARGVVPTNSYDETCEALQRELTSLRSDTGEPLVERVIRTAASFDTAMRQRLPDLIVHWSDAVFTPSLRIAGSNIQPEMVGQKYVAQHSLEGFCIAPDTLNGDEVQAEEMHLLFSKLLELSMEETSSDA